MGMKSADAKLVQTAILSAAKELEAKKEWINELNVFPVPDGDTGTNMTMTIMAAAREVAAIENPTMETIAKETGAKILVLNPFEGDTDGKDYFTVMEENLISLKKALN